MTRPCVALVAVLMVLAWQSAASAQRARFVKAEEFDTGCIKSGQFVEATFYDSNGKESHVKGYVRAIGDTSFTVAGIAEPVVIPFQDLDILIIGRLKPEIILIKHRPSDQGEDSVQSPPGPDPGAKTIA